MEVIIKRLRELEAEEVQMLRNHKALLVERGQEDERRVREQAEEDEAWQSRLEDRDREEDASHDFPFDPSRRTDEKLSGFASATS